MKEMVQDILFNFHIQHFIFQVNKIKFKKWPSIKEQQVKVVGLCR
jgi:hypothetical protein